MTDLNEIFDLPEVEEDEKPAAKAVRKSKAIVPEVLPPIVAKPQEDPLEKDFAEARQNVKLALMQGEEALDGVLDLARQSDHPRAYEVAGQLVQTIIAGSESLLKLHKQRKEVREYDEPQEGGPKEVNNTVVFVGTSTDLLEKIKQQRQLEKKDG